ncbi:hypothetical protein L3V79_02125 [Thiotrichales bacterium 19S9-12]|nr:hypothetical protein [Thiotrichales bacterium 19S9-11]MCF6811155.1 hypothetical protein [Thiotrichales bacterium 19S9-12]
MNGGLTNPNTQLSEEEIKKIEKQAELEALAEIEKSMKAIQEKPEEASPESENDNKFISKDELTNQIVNIILHRNSDELLRKRVIPILKVSDDEQIRRNSEELSKLLETAAIRMISEARENHLDPSQYTLTITEEVPRIIDKKLADIKKKAEEEFDMDFELYVADANDDKESYKTLSNDLAQELKNKNEENSKKDEEIAILKARLELAQKKPELVKNAIEETLKDKNLLKSIISGIEENQKKNQPGQQTDSQNTSKESLGWYEWTTSWFYSNDSTSTSNNETAFNNLALGSNEATISAISKLFENKEQKDQPQPKFTNERAMRLLVQQSRNNERTFSEEKSREEHPYALLAEVMNRLTQDENLKVSPEEAKQIADKLYPAPEMHQIQKQEATETVTKPAPSTPASPFQAKHDNSELEKKEELTL